MPEWLVLALPNILILVLFFLWPLALIFAYSVYTYDPLTIWRPELTWQNYVKALTDDMYVTAIVNTFQISLITTVVTLVLAYPIAYYLARTGNRMEDTVISFVVFAPMMVSVVVTSFAWVILLSPFGTIYQVLSALKVISGPLRLMFTKEGIIIGLAYGQLAHRVITLRSSLERIDWSLINAARIHGATSLRAFFDVTLPLSLPGIFAGAIVTFSLSLSSFVAPYLLGGRLVKVMSVLIYDNVLSTYNWPLGSATAAILFVVTTFCVGTFTYVLQRTRMEWLKR
jgi:putative spermidine/putrescine transport system permease protein